MNSSNTLACFIFTGVEWDGASRLLEGKTFCWLEYILGLLYIEKCCVDALATERFLHTSY